MNEFEKDQCEAELLDATDNSAADTSEGSESEASELEEINTYDAVPLVGPPSSSDKGEKFIFILKKAFSFIAVATVFLTIIFSSAEIFDLIINDMGTGNIIMKRIFGSEINGDDLSLSDLIINNMFIVPDEDPSPIIPEPPGADAPLESSQNVPKETTSPPTATETPPENSDTESPNEPTEPEGDSYPILQMDMSLLSYGKHYIYNNTDLYPNIASLSSAKLKNYYSSPDEPLVLVIHTHGTESYMPEGAKYYTDEAEIARSHDTDKNMIAIGKEFVMTLEENGIRAIHCIIMHDKESYRESYERASKSIEKYLKEYPSIKYVFDLHRDSVMRSTGELISAVTSIDGESCAQVMPVIGSGFAGWESNMSFALKLRELLNGEYTNLSRPVCLRASNYNQDMSAVSVLLEIGTSGNTLSEAKKAASLTARAVAELIKNA